VAGRRRRSRRQHHLAPLTPRPSGEAHPRARPGISACGDLISLGTGAGGVWRSRAGTTSCTRWLPLALALMTHHRSARERRGVGAAVGLRPVRARTTSSRARRSSPRPSSSRTSAPRTSPGARVRVPLHRISKGEWGPSKSAARAGRRARRLAAALAELNRPESERFPCSGSGKLLPQPTFRAPPPGYNGIPFPFMRRSSSSGRLPTLWHTSPCKTTRTQPTSMGSRTRCWRRGVFIAEPE
jgi:hypothetical protein